MLVHKLSVEGSLSDPPTALLGENAFLLICTHGRVKIWRGGTFNVGKALLGILISYPEFSSTCLVGDLLSL